MTTKEILQKALQLMGPDGENWVPRPPSICEYCALTAIYKASKCEASERMRAREHFLYTIGWSKIGQWNDAPGRTWDDVKQAFLKAIEAAQ